MKNYIKSFIATTFVFILMTILLVISQSGKSLEESLTTYILAGAVLFFGTVFNGFIYIFLAISDMKEKNKTKDKKEILKG